jgi:hypothetical protein
LTYLRETLRSACPRYRIDLTACLR